MAHPRSRTLPDLLDEISARDPAHELIVGGPTRLSYAEARARAHRLAKGLLRLGVRRGDKVA
ncbi:MAG: AMP-binding protein, partial [Candidatus Rokuibacteriota bacterium]